VTRPVPMTLDACTVPNGTDAHGILRAAKDAIKECLLVALNAEQVGVLDSAFKELADSAFEFQREDG